MAAAAYAAVVVARKEIWRRKAIWERVKEFKELSGVDISSPIISLVVGNQEKALKASRFTHISLCLLFPYSHTHIHL